MDRIELFFEKASACLWGDWMLSALLGLGIYYTCMTGFAQVRFFPYIIRRFAKEAGRGGKGQAGAGKCSSYQALCTAVASCVGSGNIVGVSTAILAGGPGALLWMWVAAFLGMATKLGEITLGMRYHSYDKEHKVIGGPMYYIAHAWKMKWVGALVAVLLFIQNAGATLIQSNTISGVAKEAFFLPHGATGILLALAMTFVISGGFQRLVHAAEEIVPVMAGMYVLCGLIVLVLRIPRLPAVLQSIIEGAFTIKAGTGAAVGLTMKEAMRFGIARGLYSNEAGKGSAAVIHSSAQADHPVRQGIYGIVEVFIDTMIICSTTGFAVLLTGAEQSHANASTLAAVAFGSVFPVMIIFGSLSTIDLVWFIQDCALGVLILPNIIALLILGPEVRGLVREFTAIRKREREERL